MTVNEAIEKLTEIKENGYGELGIVSKTIEIDGVDAVYNLNGFHYETLGITSNIIMELEEEFIY